MELELRLFVREMLSNSPVRTHKQMSPSRLSGWRSQGRERNGQQTDIVVSFWTHSVPTYHVFLCYWLRIDCSIKTLFQLLCTGQVDWSCNVCDLYAVDPLIQSRLDTYFLTEFLRGFVSVFRRFCPNSTFSYVMTVSVYTAAPATQFCGA